MTTATQPTFTPAVGPANERVRATWNAGDFGRIATSYARGASQFVNRVGVAVGERVLDVACGTGNLALPAARAGGACHGRRHRARTARASTRAGSDGESRCHLRRRRLRAASLLRRELRRRALDVRRDVRRASRSCRGRADSRMPPGRTRRARELDAGWIHRSDAAHDRRVRAASSRVPIAAPVGRRFRRAPTARHHGRKTLADGEKHRIRIPVRAVGGRGVFPRVLWSERSGVRRNRPRSARRAESRSRTLVGVAQSSERRYDARRCRVPRGNRRGALTSMPLSRRTRWLPALRSLCA